MRKEFILPEGDVDYLNSIGCQWETIRNGGNWVIIHSYQVPEGYSISQVSVALRIDAGYPISQIDMVYFSPHLQRKDGKIIGALAMLSLDGKQFQRWSRHRTGANPWRAGVDDISTHMAIVRYWLEREFQIR